MWNFLTGRHQVVWQIGEDANLFVDLNSNDSDKTILYNNEYFVFCYIKFAYFLYP